MGCKGCDTCRYMCHGNKKGLTHVKTCVTILERTWKLSFQGDKMFCFINKNGNFLSFSFKTKASIFHFSYQNRNTPTKKKTLVSFDSCTFSKLQQGILPVSGQDFIFLIHEVFVLRIWYLVLS
ncbi:uncharacterized protein LOC126668951 [Mercurialis annua]|uniref:uncharacterized protein LOC130014570 n=1 Tax=Mercurialis annua TaxID=3986 RepID=UPI002160D6B2|nr:uncharacterized protein LOC130014570 [Mercurialis annua]XP_050218170.1 uncharacterized protein LOC126668951 [Mercurialis annua]